MIHIPRVSYRVWHRCRLLACARGVYEKFSSTAVKCCNYVQLWNDRMFHSQCISLNGCRLVTVAAESETSQRLCEFQTASELLNFVGGVDSEIWTPELSSLLTERLVSTHYQSLCAIYPWLQDNVIAASKQLRMGDSLVLQDAAAPVHLHFAYNTWMNIVERSCTSYSPNQLANALLSATNLFVDLRSSLVHRLLSETHQHLPYFGLPELVALSNSLKALPGNNDILVRLLLKRMQTLLMTVESPRATELTAIAAIFSNLKKFVSYEFRDKFVTGLLQVIQSNKEVLLSPACVDVYFCIGHILSFKRKHISQTLLDIVMKTCEEYGDQLDISDVAKVCGLLHTGRTSDYICRVFDILQSRSLHLLSDDSRLCEVIGLMNCLTRRTSPQVILQFYSALHSQLICNDYIDLVSLSSIARILNKMPSVNCDLLALVQRFIVRQADIIVPHPSIFNFIERFLNHHCFLDKDLEMQFNDRLLSYVRRYDGVSKRYATSVVSPYLLPVINDGLPAPVFKHVITAVDHWCEGALFKHSSRLGSLRGLLSSDRQSCQLNTLNSLMYQNLCKQLDLVHSLDSLHVVACSLLKHGCQQHPVVTHRLMNMYKRYSSTLSNNVNAWSIASILSKLNYPLPAVYDDLVHYVINTDNADTESLVSMILFACGKVGYVPIVAEELLHLARHTYHRMIAKQNYRYALNLLHSLTILQLSADSELSKLFTLEALEDLDLYLADNLENQRLTSGIEMYMMLLNRAVVLDYPHLDVPWFRDKASKVFLERALKVRSQYTAMMVKEVRDVLSELLGGLNYLQSGVHSQYHYYLDFKCMLDEHQKPVDVSQWPRVDETGNCQKIAVCILGQKSYCYNSKHLNGHVQTKKRHLEIMNYKFLEIPHFDWFSMGLSDKKAKLDYVEKKLFR